MIILMFHNYKKHEKNATETFKLLNVFLLYVFRIFSI